MMRQALATFCSSWARCSNESFRRVLWAKAAIRNLLSDGLSQQLRISPKAGWSPLCFLQPAPAATCRIITALLQVAFTLFVLAETWLVPVEGYLVDRFGPGLLVAIGGILVGVAWWINAEASTLFTLYLGGLVGGVGAGIVYGTSVGNALKWFPERRGLATGLT